MCQNRKGPLLLLQENVLFLPASPKQPQSVFISKKHPSHGLNSQNKTTDNALPRTLAHTARVSVSLCGYARLTSHPLFLLTVIVGDEIEDDFFGQDDCEHA